MALEKRGGSGFKYQKRDSEAVKKRADQDGGNFDSIFKGGIDTFRAKQGTNAIRFLPPTWEDPEHYGYDIFVHQYIGADSGSYLCPKKMKGTACPICEAQAEANAAGEEEEAKKLRAVKKVAAWIIDRDDKKPIPKIWLMSWTMDRDIASLCHSEKTGKVIMLDDPDKGYDLTFKRTGQQLNTRYLGVAVDRDDSSLGDTQKEINTIMATVEDMPIPDTLLYKPVKYLQAVVDGKSSKKEKDPDEEDDRPSRGRRAEPEDDPEEEATSRRRPSRDRGEPEDDPEPAPRRRRAAEPDPEDDPEPEERPRRRARAEPEDDPEPEAAPRRRRAAEPDPEDDPEPPRRRRAAEPEPEEEERPSRRRAREEPEDDPEPEPAPRRRARAEPEDDPEPPRRRRAAPDPEDDPDPEPAPRRRRAEPDPEDDPEPEERPRRRRA